MDLDLLVIGDSSAGWQGAVTAASRGFSVAMIAMGDAASAATSDLRQIPQAVLDDACADWPLPPVARHAASRRGEQAQWLQFAQSVQDAWQCELDRYRDQFLAAGGEILTGWAALTGVDSARIDTVDGTAVDLSARQMLIATGTEAQRPRFASAKVAGVFDAARLLEASALPREATIVGAGITGLRAACLLAWWGVQVRVVDGRDDDSRLVEGEASDLKRRAVDLGVTFELGEDVIGLQSLSGRRVAMTFESGRRLETETVWLATGRQGRTAELQLEAAELNADDCGRLWCGAQLRTWTPSICAVGDVVGYTQEVGTEAQLVSQAIQGLLGTCVASRCRVIRQAEVSLV